MKSRDAVLCQNDPNRAKIVSDSQIRVDEVPTRPATEVA